MTFNPTPKQRDWIKQLRQHALDHYEQEGWDYLVECWSDEDILEHAEDAQTYQEAFSNIAEWMKVLDDRRRDVQGEVF